MEFYRQSLSDQIATESKDNSIIYEPVVYEPKFNTVISTGSTLLDLAISGGRVHGGGIPGGIVVEIFGPNQVGKTTMLLECAVSAQIREGYVKYCDPEARLDKGFANRVFGLRLDKDRFAYERPNTVSELFDDHIRGWKPPNPAGLNLICGDSLAALSTEMELKDGDARGQRRAKEFSEGFRKTCRDIASSNWILLCSNQVRETDYGFDSPGGQALRFYASLRIRVKAPSKNKHLERQRKIGDNVYTKVFGIKSECQVIKSSLDDPFREAPIYIDFDHGIDDIRANLIFVRGVSGNSTYFGGDYKTIEPAIDNIEKKNLEEELREETISIWTDLENDLKRARKIKVRR